MRAGWPQDITDTIRIDRGPRVRKAKASLRSLSDTVSPREYKLGGPDAFGKMIKTGQMFHYVDWLAGPEGDVFTVYQHDGNRYQIVKRYDTEDEARAAAAQLAGG